MNGQHLCLPSRVGKHRWLEREGRAANPSLDACHPELRGQVEVPSGPWLLTHEELVRHRWNFLGL
jgi:hypothetical protein